MIAPFFMGTRMITAVVMVGQTGGGESPVSMVQNAKRAASRDLIEQLAVQELIERIVIVSPSIGELGSRPRVEYIQSPAAAIHVGRHLSQVASRYGVKRLLYFGGGSAPLLDDPALSDIVYWLAHAEQGIFTNNQFASDWAAIVPASILGQWKDRLPQDNMLGWVLSAEAGMEIQTFSASAKSRLDIDTPSDLLTLRLHPDTKPHLHRFLAALDLDTSRLEEALDVLATPASQILLAGRLAPEPWQALNKATHCWFRVISEERGMVSSGRQGRGEVYSILAEQIELVTLRPFFDRLAEQVQAAFIDTRVLMAHHGRWPSDDDRFASDLGLVDQIDDPWLKELSSAALDAPIPIVLGGHGLLAGDLFAFCDLL